MKLSDYNPINKFFGLLKGEPGTGKTIAGTSFPTPIYVADLDGRMKSVLNFWKKHDPERLKQIEFDQFGSFFQLKDRLKKLRFEPFKTVMLDSLTAEADLVIKQMMMEKGDSGKKVGGQRVASIEDYGGEASGLMEVLDILRTLYHEKDMNVFLTAHVIKIEEKDATNPGSTSYSRSLLTGGKKIAAKLPVYFDEVWHFQVKPSINVAEPPKFTCITRHAGSDYAKTSVDLPNEIDFTNKNLYEEVCKHLGISPTAVKGAPTIAGGIVVK